ncbi:hypothetical protein BP5796_01181 [Coleophoma crateriformis]|uniref:Uncharacterized protein n=1 Tax=Coleophoma crateriformis TaxID=565419 RepID=A0A3D8SZN6_9HELO|nr:hypothetical protein BP5796_01181 [Coleophoma crateriformis]
MSPRLQSETARERELYKYWQPNETVFPSAEYDESFNHDYQPRPSYDSALTAYAQLGALRCNAKRGMISVVDQNYQYIIAEGTKTLSLQDGSVVDQDDQLWFGLRTIPRAMGICAKALGQFTMVEDHDGCVSDVLFEPMQFIISDLSKDPRFVNQPFVCGAPYLRFYAGVPIRSPAGYIIGIYSIVDDKPREDFGERDLNVLKDLAATVMDHLVLGTVRGRHYRADRMVKGLGLFVEGKSTLRDWWLRSGYLGKGPTTKDGSKGGWTLTAQADAEFGPQVGAASKSQMCKAQAGLASSSPITITTSKETSMDASKKTSMDTSVEPSMDTSMEASMETSMETSALSGFLNAALCLASGNQVSDSSMTECQDSHKTIQLTAPEKLDPANPSVLGQVSKDADRISPTKTPILLSSTELGEENSPVQLDTETLSMSQDMGAIFKRASNLIRESITVEGCLFLDAGPAAIKHTPILRQDEKREPSRGRSVSPERRLVSEDERSAFDIFINGTASDSESSYLHPDLHSPGSMCELLGYSLQFGPYLSDGKTKPKFRFPKEFLHRLFQRYPNGTILNFETDGGISSGEEDHKSSSDNLILDESDSSSRSRKRRTSLRALDAKIITDTFPGIRCLAFFPLWDTHTKTWFCGGLIWTNDPLRVLDPNDDMAYLAAFGNSIMAEKARLDASIADRMKGNFISTVSHELRSPLHGILASAELLKDMTLSPGQIDVVNMINTCGRTLLDTINHVLDFTELNRLRRPKLPRKKKLGDQEASKKPNNSVQSLVNPLQNLDLSVLVEEVVESTLAGYDFGHSQSAVMLSSDTQGPSFGHETTYHGKIDVPIKSRVKVILDIDQQSSWISAIQPGAWRRIVMNVFGNALKYTEAGCICISLQSIPSVSKQNSRPSVILTVSDTGKGISKQFLKHHVFTPFLQEDTLATGTGLGLSIVQDIVHGLEGEIEIQSEIGLGTKVIVQVPFGVPTSTSSSSQLKDSYAHLESVLREMKGLKVYIAPFKDSSESTHNGISRIPECEALCVLSVEKSLRKTLAHWFGMEVVEAPSLESAEADIYLLFDEEINRPGTTERNDSLAITPKMNRLANANALMVLGTSQTSSSKSACKMGNAIHYIQQPFGPHKLTRAFDAYLKQKAMSTQQLPVQLDCLPTKPLSLDNIVANSELPDNASDIKTRDDDNNLTSNMKTLTTKLVTLVKSAQVPAVSERPTVLLVDDNEINLKLLVMYMRKLGYPYRTAVDGLEALETFKKDPLPLRFILMDITMPVMDGLTATQEIRRHERELGLPPSTIVALTGASSADARQKAISSGIDRFFTKPVPLKIVREVIKG